MLKARILMVEDKAVRKAGELEPDLVLMDIRLKGEVDGIEAAVRIHEGYRIPIVYLTAYPDDNTPARSASGSAWPGFSLTWPKG